MLWKKLNNRTGRSLTSLWSEILQNTVLNIVVRTELIEKFLEKSKGFLCRYLHRMVGVLQTEDRAKEKLQM